MSHYASDRPPNCPIRIPLHLEHEAIEVQEFLVGRLFPSPKLPGGEQNLAGADRADAGSGEGDVLFAGGNAFQEAFTPCCLLLDQIEILLAVAQGADLVRGDFTAKPAGGRGRTVGGGHSYDGLVRRR